MQDTSLLNTLESPLPTQEELASYQHERLVDFVSSLNRKERRDLRKRISRTSQPDTKKTTALKEGRKKRKSR